MKRTLFTTTLVATAAALCACGGGGNAAPLRTPGGAATRLSGPRGLVAVD